jgi:hypothetical protein
VVKQLREGYHLNRLRSEKLLLTEDDANHGKTWVHQRLSTPLDQSGAMTFMCGIQGFLSGGYRGSACVFRESLRRTRCMTRPKLT